MMHQQHAFAADCTCSYGTAETMQVSHVSAASPSISAAFSQGRSFTCTHIQGIKLQKTILQNHSMLSAHAGRVSRLQFRYPDESLGQNWISSSGLFARAQYSTYTERDYNVIWDNYSYASDATWFAQDFGKPNCSLAQPRRADNSAYGFSTSWWQVSGQSPVYMLMG